MLQALKLANRFAELLAILEIGERAREGFIGNAKQFRELAATLPAGRSVPVLIQRQGGPLFLAMKVPQK